ncbi:MAG: PilZ domain-containing protein [Nitrospirota bacterium]
MFITGNLREYSRTQFVRTIRYSISVLDMKELKRIQDTAVSIDISKGGLGIITNYPLKTGHILDFDNEVKMDDITAKSAVVRWAEKINGNKYRVGLKFI